MSYSNSHQSQQSSSHHYHQSQQSQQYVIPPASPFTPKWYYTKEELLRIPSIRDGINPEHELKLRQQAVAFIHDLSEKLNQNVKENKNRFTNCICVATIHFHRFFVFHSMRIFHPKDVAAACYFLAGKSEDCAKKLDSVVKQWLVLKHNLERPPDMDLKKYEEAADYIVLLESMVLQTIVELPHPIVLKVMTDIFKDSATTGTRSRSIMETAYFFASDILLMTNWAVRYSMKTIACMCILLMTQWAEFEIPNNSKTPWYLVVDPKLNEKLIAELSSEFTKIYKNVDKNLVRKRFLNGRIMERPSASISSSSSAAFLNSQTSTSHNHQNNHHQKNEQQLIPPPPEPPSLSRIGVELTTSSTMAAIKREATGDVFDGPPSTKIHCTTTSMISGEKKQKKLDLREYRERMAAAAATTEKK